MPSWTDLPPELRRKCVKNMSLMSRLSLRNCSSRDRIDVDDVVLSIPRLRARMDGIVSGVEVFDATGSVLKQELRFTNENCVVSRSSSSHHFNPSFKVIPYENMESIVRLGTSFWNSILRNFKTKGKNKVQILEIHNDFLYEVEHDLLETLELILKPQKIVYVAESTDSGLESFWDVSDRLGVFNEPQYPESYRIVMNTDKVKEEVSLPNVIIETIDKDGKKHVTYFYNRKFGEHGNFLQELLSMMLTFKSRLTPHSWASMSFPLLGREKAEEIIEKVPGVIEKSGSMTIKRYHPLDNQLIRFHLTTCGFWVDAMTSSPDIPEKPLKTPCGMGVACERHTPHFDYCFFKKMAKRLEKKNRKELVQEEWWKKYGFSIFSLVVAVIGVVIYLLWE